MILKTPVSITKVVENESHKQSHNVARARWRESNPASSRYNNVPTRFVCIDGEGITLPNGSHSYVLLGVGDQQIANPNGLSWEEICEFLWEQFNEHGTKSVAYTGFFLSYDFIQWVRQLPEERARMLLTSEGIAKRAPKSDKRIQPFPVRYGDWEFDILGSKRFRLRRVGSKRWMNICDTGPFFQKSFVKVINPDDWSEPIVTEQEYNEIVLNKSKRGVASLDVDMYHYNALENEILARVLERLNDGFQSLGIHLRPGEWFGPGQAAQAWLKTRAITGERLAEIIPPGVLDAARASYFGGWFEIMAHGPIPGITYEYDINSAYPFIISELPCLEHGKWRQSKSIRSRETRYVLVYASVTGHDKYIGGMLHRDKKGNISRPHKTEGWYWLHEIHAGRAAKIIDTVHISSVWTYYPCDCMPPLREVRDIYNLRKEVGKTTPLGIACKLVPNSLYGKFAQSIGTPKYGNPIYASLITAGCRTMILNAIASHPEATKDVVMVATDGVYFRSVHPSLPLSGELGNWDSAEKKNICLFKPGVYWDDKARLAIQKGTAPVFKARGVNANDLGKRIAQIDLMFHDLVRYGTSNSGKFEDDRWPAVRFPVNFAMTTALQALHRNDWSQAGAILPDAFSQQSSHPGKKRSNPYFENGILRTTPRENDPYEKSHPYEKRFGIEDPFSDVSLERHGITPDGLVANVFREAINLVT
jgi:hypothetical protein